MLIGIAVASATMLLAVHALQPTTLHAASNIAWPAPAGSQWVIASGYNTATHSAADSNDPYAIDVVRTDAPTAGTRVLSPIDGRIGYASGDCVSVTDAQQTSALICHLLFPAGLRGRSVLRGELLGTIAPDGQAGNGGTAHIHLALARNRLPIPFAGDYNLEGLELIATTTPNAYSGTAFTSSNAPRLGVSAGGDQQVRPGTTVTMLAIASGATGAVTYQWTQTSGPAVALTATGGQATFTASVASGSVLQFQVIAYSAGIQPSTDAITITVSDRAPIVTPVPTPALTPGGVFIGSPVFSADGVAFAVFGGGSVGQLEVAASLARARGAWVQDSRGTYQLLAPAGPAFLNDSFRTAFPAGFSTPVAVTLVR